VTVYHIILKKSNSLILTPKSQLKICHPLVILTQLFPFFQILIFVRHIKVELLEIYMVILHKYKHNAILVLKKIYIHKSIMQIHIVSVLDFQKRYILAYYALAYHCYFMW
jgi:hypothetical protein